MNKQTQDLLTKWGKYATQAETGHDITSVSVWRRNDLLGYPTIALSALVGTAIFATFLAENALPAVRILAGVLSVVATILSAVQTRANLGQKYEQHRSAVTGYGNLKRRIERLKGSSQMDDAEIQQAEIQQAEIQQELDAAGIGSA